MQLLLGVFLFFAFGNSYVDAVGSHEFSIRNDGQCHGWERNYGDYYDYVQTVGSGHYHTQASYAPYWWVCRNWFYNGGLSAPNGARVLCMSGDDCHFYNPGSGGRPGWANQHTCSLVAASGKNLCLTCGDYEYADGTSCKARKCNKGLYNCGTNHYQCCRCHAGKYQHQNNQQLHTCHNCPKGTYQNDHSAHGCKTCPDGQYQNSDGQSGCKNCQANTYRPAGSAADHDELNDCWACPKTIGTYSTNSAAGNGASSNCYSTRCYKGYHLSGSGTSRTCIACTGDYFQPNDDSASTSCTAWTTCGVGQYQNDGNTYTDATCSDCGVGKYQDTNDNSGDSASCKDCDAGSYSGGGVEECTRCPEGTYSGTGQETCDICSDGKQAQSTTSVDINAYVTDSATECVTCQNGYDNTDGNQCDVCAAGYFSVDGATCALCPPGSITDTLADEGGSTCTHCPAGKYSADSRQACQVCPAGHVTNTLTGIGATTCTQCPPGKWTANSVEPCKEWTICDPGFYLAGHTQNNDGVCTQCVDGTYCPGGSSYSSIDMGYPGVKMYCAADHEGIDNVNTRSSHENSCVKCGDGFVGDTYVSQTTSGLGDESMSSEQCEDYATSVGLVFEEVYLSDRPWGCHGYNGQIHYNYRKFNTRVLCTEAIPCYKNVADQGTADCSECLLGTFEIDGVCNPWTFANQSECAPQTAFVVGHSSKDAVCVSDFIFELDEPSDSTFDLTIDSIMCGDQYAQLDPQGNVVCKDCHRQEFLDVYRGPIITTEDSLKRGSCCSNSHHHVCIQMMNEYRKKCGTLMVKGSNQCV